MSSEAITAEFHYLSRSAAPSLRRNGRVFLRRDPDGNDSDTTGLVRETVEKPVHDARRLSPEDRPTLTANGFELVARPSEAAGVDFFDQAQIVRRYYPDCERIVAEATGGRAFAFDHNVRSAAAKGKRIQGGQQVQQPLHFVHGDYTLTSGPQRLRDLASAPGGNDTLRGMLPEGASLLSAELVDRALSAGGRFAIVNLWRNIAPEPVAKHPLAVCDARSVEPEDLVVFEIHYRDRIGENYFARPMDRHRWSYFSAMTGDEAMLIKQWDSAGTLARSEGVRSDAFDPEASCTFGFHSAFDDPGVPTGAPDRKSIEVRCVVVYE